MNPRLLALSGPRTGEAFELSPGVSTVGRHSEATIRLTSRSVSRWHCDVEMKDGEVRVRDRQSRIGTFVNDRAVSESRLVDGDRLRVSDTTFQLRSDETEEQPPEPPWLTDDDLATRAALVEPLTDAELFSETGEVLSKVADASAQSVLSSLLQVALESDAVRDLDSIGRVILPLVLKAIPAERAVLLLPDDPVTAVYGFRDDEWRGDVSRTASSRALEEGVALLWNRADDAGVVDAPSSLLTGNIWSVLALPLPATGEANGVLYLDSRSPESRFDEGHLHVGTAFAGLLSPRIANLRYQQWLDDERLRLQARDLDHDMVGQSPAMERALSVIARVAAADSTALIRGESGTGKELAARAIHRSSARARRPFVAINCAALSENLLESELFGHERGAFTGADRRKTGKVEVADSGTLFLDELGELPLSLQAKLLRFLEEREFERIGGTRPLKVDVRVLAATNRDLAAEVKKGGFREDLYHRLNVISIELPPLRERAGDVPLLAAHFAGEHCARLKRPVMGFSRQARALMERYRWPGNVRELANAIERAVVLGDGELIRPEDLSESLLEAGGGVKIGRYHDVLRETKKKLILGAVREAEGKYTEAARILGLNSNYLHRLIRNLELKDEIENG